MKIKGEGGWELVSVAVLNDQLVYCFKKPTS
jgi:hypothetical protein